MRIIDCFIFYNEIDMLKYRLALLYNIVDKFVLIEAVQTFVGNPKSLYYDMYKDTILSEYKDKIEHIVVSLPFNLDNTPNIKNVASNNEAFQRNSIGYAIDDLAESDSDIFLLSDVDEIPNPELLKSIKNGDLPITVASLEQDFYIYNLNCKIKNTKWTHPKIFRYDWYNTISMPCENIRMNKCDVKHYIQNGGWHLSYFGTSDFILNKVKNFSHTELNIESINSKENIQYSMNNHNCFFNPSMKIEYIPIESNPNLPPNVLDYLNIYAAEKRLE